MLTLFGIPKSFEGHIGMIQRNAIQSWTLLKPRPEIILFGKDKGVAEICSEFGLKHVPEVDCNEYGTPLLNDLFRKAQEISSHPVLCYVNADIILLDDFSGLVKTAIGLKGKWLVMAQRWQLDVREPLDFGGGWQDYLIDQLEKKGGLGGGSDFFIFSKDLYQEIPSFAIGRGYWDCWLVWGARKSGAKVIDATHRVYPIHQNHDYAFVKNQDQAEAHPEVQHNYKLNGGWTYFFQPSRPTHRLTTDGLRQSPPWDYVFHVGWRLLAYLIGSTYQIRRRLGLYRWQAH